MAAKVIRIVLIILSLLMVLWGLGARFADAGERPIHQVEELTRNILSILNSSENDKQAAIRSTARDKFDWKRMARSSVGRSWKSFESKEKAKFIQLFRSLIEQKYLAKIKGENFKDVVIVCLREERLSDTKVLVKTKVLRGDIETPVDYRMVQSKSGTWLIYDVNIEGVSLIKNYRSQFKAILTKNPKGSYLIGIIESKLEKQT